MVKKSLPETGGSKATSATSAEAEVFSLSSSVTQVEAVAKRLRRHIVTMIGKAGSGHPGGSLSAVEIVATLYYKVMRHRPLDPQWPDRDRFILSKGHAAPVLYATLAECGYFPVKELLTLRQMDSRLQGHTDRTITPGVEMSAGSLGQGLSFALGTALAGGIDDKDYRVYVLMGDGECNEGQVWEAAMATTHYGVDNLTAIVDNNGQQIDGWNCDVMSLDPFPAKWQSFGWKVIEVDGHSVAKLIEAFKEAQKIKGQPTVIIAHTIKGKGVSYMENNPDFHGMAPNTMELEMALKELK